jgi:hypothetical protein
VAFAIALIAVLSTCGKSNVVSPAPTQLSLGTWGGDNAAANVNDTIVHVHVGCTFGDIKGRVALDASGRFNVSGTYVLRAYPVYVGPELPAQFSGVVEGRKLTIAIAVHDTTQGKVVALGPVTITLGADPKMGPCPICTMPGMKRYSSSGSWTPPFRQPLQRPPVSSASTPRS